MLVAVLGLACERSPATRAEQGWIAVAAGADTQPRGMALTDDGAAYVVGSFSGALQLGGQSLGGADGGASQRAFVARLGPDGLWSWGVAAAGAGSSSANGVALDPSGNVYVVGEYQGTLQLGQESAQSATGYQAFVARLGPKGAVDWLTSSSGSAAAGAGFGRGIAVDSDGSSYITGLFSQELTLGSTSLDAADVDYFVASLDSTGSFLWAKAGAAGEWAVGRDIALAPDDAVVVVGELRGSMADGTTSRGKADLFVAKHRRGGGLLWTSSAGGPDDDSGQAVDVDGQGDIWVTGGYTGSASFGADVVESMESSDDVLAVRWSGGKLIGAVSVGGSRQDQGQQIALAPDGTIRLAGRISGNVVLDGANVSAGARGLLVWQLSPGEL